MDKIKLLKVAMNSVKAGELELLRLGKSERRYAEMKVQKKGLGDYQTALDRKIELKIGNVIREQYPNHRIIGEECLNEQGEDATWYVDPVDGTRNLITGRPEVAISVAVYQASQPLVGIISLPFRKTRIWTYEGAKKAIYTSPRCLARPQKMFSDELVGLQGDVHDNSEKNSLFNIYNRLISDGYGIRITGALAYDLATLALGELGSRISIAAKSVDVAAGAFLVKQLGGKVTSISGDEWTVDCGSLLASRSPKMHKRLLKVIS